MGTIDPVAHVTLKLEQERGEKVKLTKDQRKSVKRAANNLVSQGYAEWRDGQLVRVFKAIEMTPKELAEKADIRRLPQGAGGNRPFAHHSTTTVDEKGVEHYRPVPGMKQWQLDAIAAKPADNWVKATTGEPSSSGNHERKPIINPDTIDFRSALGDDSCPDDDFCNEDTPQGRQDAAYLWAHKHGISLEEVGFLLDPDNEMHALDTREAYEVLQVKLWKYLEGGKRMFHTDHIEEMILDYLARWRIYADHYGE
jgi:hypothetical protein